MTKQASKTQAKAAAAEVISAQTEGLAEAEGSMNFEPGFGRYQVRGAGPLRHTPRNPDDPSGRGKERFSLSMEILEGTDEDGEDLAGRFFSHTLFVTNPPDENSEDPDKEAFKRRMDLNRVKDLFNAFGVEVGTTKTGASTWDPAAFEDATATMVVKDVLDKDSGERRVSDSGKPWKDYKFYAKRE